MELTFWGIRGSYPIARQDNVKYGGNSTCIHVRTLPGEDWIIDGGSGIRPLGRSLMRREFGKGGGVARILIGHTHWDHILGFPFFEPFLVEGNKFEIYSAGQEDADIEEILAGQQHRVNFPVPFEALKADIRFYTLEPGDSLVFGSTKISVVQLNHPGITLGYRLQTMGVSGSSLVVYTDTARIDAVRLGDGMPRDDSFRDKYKDLLREHAKNADLLVHDAHFNEEEISGKEHWGHSTPADAVMLAKDAGVKRLALFHHAPEHNDRMVDEQVEIGQKLAGDSIEVFGAREGESIVLRRLGE
ncbi:MAG: MBL fold metallo-hydrolase [Deltaproteobacteria bacterium]|nr:MBL fold metallo-hydrolase [Deltaproteobacteria bacterium]